MTRTRCPHCEHETARIIYGFSVIDDKFQKDIDEQRVFLAGCEKMIHSATRHCFYCDKDVCYTFLLVDEAETTYVEFEVGGFHEGYQKIVVLECETIMDLTEKEYKKFIHNVYISYIKE